MARCDDQFAIMQLITQADQLAGQKDAKGYVALFAEDGAIEGTQGQATGHEALMEMVQRVWQQEGQTLHLTSSVVIQSLTANTATATSILVIVEVTSRQIVSLAQVTHQLEQIKGQWLFTKRSIQ
ncbi:nuclear transport factor 2 family protein [Lacticaseibacillus brantae]|nr:nuclear transport factor 2 family protein [Lacticaseibacillus brantae]